MLSRPIMRTITQYCLRALLFLPAVLIIGWFFVRPWMITSARAREDHCASTVVAMKATIADVRPEPPQGWPDGAREDRSSRYPYLATVLEQAGCPETLATLRSGGRVLPSWAVPVPERR